LKIGESRALYLLSLELNVPIQIYDMPRKYYKRTYKKDKYSVEQTNVLTPAVSSWSLVEVTDETKLNSRQFAIPIIPSVAFQGMRKVKHLTISICNTASSTEDLALLYSIAFVPQGYEPQTISVPNYGYAQNNYQSNQFIMSSGVIDFSAGPARIRTRLSRNLNSGDSIILLLATPNLNAGSALLAQVSYAITLQ